MRIDNPCKGCIKRHAECHPTCKKYKEFREEVDELAKLKRQRTQLYSDLKMHRMETVRRCSNYRVKVYDR